jgi:XRE family aerobic/anaerobic benzoate catabolism transcriptional regulator
MDTNYNATRAEPSSRGDKRALLLSTLGGAVRARRTELGLTIRALAKRADVSERFLAQLEAGAGNISVARLQDVADALGTSASELLSTRPKTPGLHKVIALLGLRGAGKSTLGAEIARRLSVPFFELDALVAAEAGMPLATIFEMHGEAYFHRLEREVLRSFLDAHPAAVLATGGSIVTQRETYEMMRQRTMTVWLKARPQDHWDRVVRQGDMRPMRNRANAMAELKTLLRTRRELYVLADTVVDTSATSLDQAATRIVNTAMNGKGGRMRSARRADANP